MKSGMPERLDPTKGPSDGVLKVVSVIDSKDPMRIQDFQRLPDLGSIVVVVAACIDGDSEIATLLEAFCPEAAVAEGRKVRTFLEDEATDLRPVTLHDGEAG